MLRLLPAILAFALAVPARADTLELLNGQRHVGTILEETADAVTIQEDGIAWTIARAKIKAVQREGSERKREERRANELKRRHEERLKAVLIERYRVPPRVVAARDSVVIYGTSWCGYCVKAREWFRRRGVPFVDSDIERDSAANAELQQKKASAGIRTDGVPIVDVNGRLVRGFDPAQYEANLRSR